MLKKSGIHCVVTGKVQGVWFRASTKTQAESLNLTGWVRNLPDGCVEVMAYGTDAQLEQLQKWLTQGPPLAKVTDITSESCEWQECNGFEIV